MKQGISKKYIIVATVCILLILALSIILVGRLKNKPVEQEPPIQIGEMQPEKPNKGESIQEDVEKMQALKECSERGLFILVNKANPVDVNYKPTDLESIKYFAADRSPESRFMRKEATEAFHKLSEAAQNEGHEIVVTTAYRSYNFQKILYDNYVRNNGQAAADTFSAEPGKSEHQTGLAADVSSPSVNYQLTGDYIDTPEGKWLSENAHKFGFIIRFPKGKEEITGYMYEPWHIRYVGETAAEEIFNQGITLEEFLQKEYLQESI